MKAGARVDADEYEKEDVRDFVLWKAAKEGEPCWDTELGPRPARLAPRVLGDVAWRCSARRFDIHTGGVDNIFPHHENEIAQSEGATGKPFVHTWLHAEHLIVEGEKMAKSKGNFFTLRDLLERGHDPVAIRYLLISVPYRQKLNFTFDGLHGAPSRRASASATRCGGSRTRPPAAGDGGARDRRRRRASRRELVDGLADDLNTARALAALHMLLTRVNQALDGDGIAAAGRAPGSTRRSAACRRASSTSLPAEAGGGGRRRRGRRARGRARRRPARRATSRAPTRSASELAARGIVARGHAARHGVAARGLSHKPARCRIGPQQLRRPMPRRSQGTHLAPNTWSPEAASGSAAMPPVPAPGKLRKLAPRGV